MCIVAGRLGAGKSTFCSEIRVQIGDRAGNTPANVISVGDLLRLEAEKLPGLGEKLSAGLKVGDKIVMPLVFRHLRHDALNVLDNFPQSMSSLNEFIARLSSDGFGVPKMLAVHVTGKPKRHSDLGEEVSTNREKQYQDGVLPMLSDLRGRGICVLNLQSDFIGVARKAISSSNYRKLL